MSDINGKFAAAWSRVENPPLDSVNPHFKSKFASLGAVLKAIRKACDGIAYIQAFDVADMGGESILHIKSWVQDGEGRLELSRLRMPITDNPQQQGSIITYYRRYVAVTDWGIVGEEDDDAESAMNPKNDYDRQRSAKKAAQDELADLWQQCIDLGVKPDGLKSWYEANGFKGKKLNQLTGAERQKVKAYLTDMRKSIQSV